MNKPINPKMLAVIFFLLGLASFFAASNISTTSKGEPLFYLMFPKDERVPIFTSKDLSADNTLGFLKRGVVTNPSERAGGVVEVSTDSGVGYLRLSDMRFLPPEGNNTNELVTEWEKALERLGETGSKWDYSTLDSGLKEVTFILNQNRYARSYNYTFTTDGEKIIDTQTKIKSGIISGPFVLLSGILFIFAIIFGYRALRRKSS